MAKQKSKKQPRRVRSSLATRLLLLILLAAAGWQLYTLQIQLDAAQAEKDQYSAQVAQLQQKNEDLAADIAEGSTEEKMTEIARDELDWAYSNEYIFYDKRS